ncbi:hypothetical protein HRbin10_02731 [bacterium HR10]|nr:hypothetical protein HRbin10_02731 [bacterium HR10]
MLGEDALHLLLRRTIARIHVAEDLLQGLSLAEDNIRATTDGQTFGHAHDLADGRDLQPQVIKPGPSEIRGDRALAPQRAPHDLLREEEDRAEIELLADAPQLVIVHRTREQPVPFRFEIIRIDDPRAALLGDLQESNERSLPDLDQRSRPEQQEILRRDRVEQRVQGSPRESRIEPQPPNRYRPQEPMKMRPLLLERGVRLVGDHNRDAIPHTDARATARRRG